MKTRHTYRPFHPLPLLLAAVAVALLSCGSDDGTPYGAVPITLHGSISQASQGATRAATTLYDSFYGGEQVDVSIYRGSAVNAGAVIVKENNVYTMAPNGDMTPPSGMEPYFPMTADGQVTIRASYPGSGSGATVAVTVPDDQTADDDYKAGELLWAETTVTRTAGTAAVPLTFHHRMAKIVVNLTSRDGRPVLPTTVRLLQFQPTATLTKADGTVTASGTATDITMSTDGAAMVPPQTIAADTPIFEIETAQGDIAQYASPTALVFKPDHVYTYDVQVDMRKIIVTTTITSWGEPESGNIFEGDVVGEVWN